MKRVAKTALLSSVTVACSLYGMGTAYAQSNVTLHGLIDESLNYVSNEGGHSAFTQASGNMQGSRWGIKGTEDLGGGYQASPAIWQPAVRRVMASDTAAAI
jgi:predicted porin